MMTKEIKHNYDGRRASSFNERYPRYADWQNTQGRADRDEIFMQTSKNCPPELLVAGTVYEQSEQKPAGSKTGQSPWAGTGTAFVSTVVIGGRVYRYHDNPGIFEEVASIVGARPREALAMGAA